MADIVKKNKGGRPPNIIDGPLAYTLKAQFLTAFRASFGNISEVCEAIAIPRSVYLEWMERDVDFRIAVTEATEAVGDFVESKLIEKIRKGDTLATIFYAKTKLKNRGYTERAASSDGEVPQSGVQVNVQVVHNNVRNAKEITNEE